MATFTVVFSFSVETYNGTNLQFWRLERKQMGAYLCIASNDVPPAVSKRIALNVNCELAITRCKISSGVDDIFSSINNVPQKTILRNIFSY